MCDDWMPTLHLPLTWEQYCRLPRNPAYKYEYQAGQAVLSPRTRFYHARLDLAGYAPRPDAGSPEGVALRPVGPGDVAGLEGLFAAAFERLQPFGSLDEAGQLRAARGCLERTRSGGDGPWIGEASFRAEGGDGATLGAVLVTLLPPGDPCDWETYYWHQPPPADAVARRLGQPHLTWVFVAPRAAGEGVGTALLAAAVYELRRLGFPHLLSTFLLGNESSMLWHWRNGFELLPYPGSFRRPRPRNR